MKHKICHIKNVARLAEAGDALINRGPGMPGMGLISGATGYGKTTASAWFVNQCRGIYVRAMAMWSPSSMLIAILRELDCEPRGRNSHMVDVITEKLAQHGRPLFVDEADYLLDSKRMLETLRDVHDLSTVPVILIGEEDAHRKLRTYKRLTRRIAEHVEFAGADLEDARILADNLCEVKVADDLLEQLHYTACAKKRGSKEVIGGASVGLMVVGLSRIEQNARHRGLKTVHLKDWKRGSDFFLGEAPSPEAPRADVVRLNQVG